MKGISVVVPALNEEMTIGSVIDDLNESLRKASIEFEIIVVNDGSTDRTSEIAESKGAKIISHPVPGGYGLSIRDGILSAQYDLVGLIDADGTYPANRISDLLKFSQAYDMVVGARTGKYYRESLVKYPLRKIFQFLCIFVTGIKIPDANSGFRIFKRDVVLKFRRNFCYGFSFTTTITLAFFLNGHFVKYVPVDYHKRLTKSHVKFLKDSLRTTQIITEAILYYNPFKLFLLLFLKFLFFSVLSFGFYLANQSALALSLGQTLLVISCLFLGMGFLAVTMRQSNNAS